VTINKASMAIPELSIPVTILARKTKQTITYFSKLQTITAAIC
jgi:hypothetical protein